MKAIRLKTEYLTDPVGISILSPRLFWNIEDGKKQTGYQLIAQNEDGEILADTGKVSSSAMNYHWKKEPIDYCSRVNWKVRVFDENDNVSEYAEAYFETGLPENKKWPARWIAGNYWVKRKNRYPVDCFMKKFECSDVKKGRLYITACGLYEAVINGKKVGDAVMTPGITDYRKKIHYQTYDIGSLLKDGTNTIEIMLADGWYRGSVGSWGIRNQYGCETKLLAQLVIETKKGEIINVVTDRSWLWSNDGSIRFADNKDGEIVDANMVPSYNDSARETTHNVIPTASNNVQVKEHEHLKPKLIITPKGRKVLDFGQNIAGYISFKVEAKEGQRLYLRFGEMLDFDGEFTQRNIQLKMKNRITPLQEVKYTCKEGINEYKTRFAIFGFQYVMVETDIIFDADDFTSIAVYSDMEQTGWFNSSNKLLNQFFEATIWSAKGNSNDLPTDCPTRERHGWTGDAQIFCNTASYLFDYKTFAEKFIKDMYCWQRKDGCLPHIVPDGGADFYMYAMNGSNGWADAGIIMPYILYNKYNDKNILQRYLKGMRKYAGFIKKRVGSFYLTARKLNLNKEERKYLNNAGQHYGEWAEPEDVHKMHWTDCVVTHPETATAYSIYVMDLMSEIERILGNEEQSLKYQNFADRCRKSYQALREKCPEYTLDTDRQARLVRPLYFNLLNKEQKLYAEKRLIEALNNYGWRLATGFLSTPLILYVLEKIDKEYAYRLLENEELPGWLAMPKHGATTIWEAWEGNASSNVGLCSLNHYSKGAVCSWLFEIMCGIKVSSENHFVIRPVPGGNFQYASAKYQSVYGLVKSGWEKTENGYKYTVDIPSNCTAEVILPDGKIFNQQAGKTVYES
jgi:alpha-L-rhamnosidase